jgi:hypothetical protein
MSGSEKPAQSPSIAELVGNRDESIRGKLERAHEQHTSPANAPPPSAARKVSDPLALAAAATAVAFFSFLPTSYKGRLSMCR